MPTLHDLRQYICDVKFKIKTVHERLQQRKFIESLLVIVIENEIFSIANNKTLLISKNICKS